MRGHVLLANPFEEILIGRVAGIGQQGAPGVERRVELSRAVPVIHRQMETPPQALRDLADQPKGLQADFRLHPLLASDSVPHRVFE